MQETNFLNEIVIEENVLNSSSDLNLSLISKSLEVTPTHDCVDHTYSIADDPIKIIMGLQLSLDTASKLLEQQKQEITKLQQLIRDLKPLIVSLQETNKNLKLANIRSTTRYALNFDQQLLLV